MTDKEIIKALECYSCMEDGLHEQALDLINRQQAENNRQKAEIEKLQLSRKQKLKEIERLKKGWKADVIETENIKAKAIKEVLDKLKDTKIKFGGEYMIYADNIDVIEKEMGVRVSEEETFRFYKK